MEIRSYRRVFDLERRVYSIDRFRLNPGGIPVRGLVYFSTLLTASLVGARLPGLGLAMGALPWYLADLALPVAGATLLSLIRVEGRTFHLAGIALLRHTVWPSGLCCLTRPGTVEQRWYPEQIVFLPDGSDARMRRLSYRGPGAVLVAIEHERGGATSEHGSVGVAPRWRRSSLTLRERPEARALGEGQVIALAPGARLLVLTPNRGSVNR